MKKRSLVSAVAMLIVSAIVLTSATYAWFASNTNANISEFTADVGNAAGSIYISKDGTNWKSTLTASELTGVAGALTPVSYDKKTDHFTGGSFTADSLDFTATPTANTGYYTAVTVYVYTEVAGTVTVTPTLSAIANVPYVYASAKSGDQQIILGSSNDSYYPLITTDGQNDGTATDNNSQNGIIDAEEASSGTNITVRGDIDKVSVSGSSLTLNMQAGETNKQQVTFYVWAEGQDSNCVGTSQGAPAFNVGFAFTPSASSTNA